MTDNELPLCACGCGKRVLTKGSRFCQGHNTAMRKANTTSKESIEYMKKKLRLERGEGIGESYYEYD